MKKRKIEWPSDFILVMLSLVAVGGVVLAITKTAIFAFEANKWMTSPYGSYFLKDSEMISRIAAVFLMIIGCLALLSLLFPDKAVHVVDILKSMFTRMISQKTANILVCLVLIAITLCVYFASFQIGFHSDDYVWLMDSEKSAHSIWHVFSLSQSHFFKPITHLYHFTNYLLFNGNPHLGHISGLLFHGLNAFLLYLVAFALSDKKDLSFLAAVLFCVYSVSNRSVMWLSGSEITLAGSLYLLSILFLVFYLRNDKKLHLLLSVSFCILGMLAKDAVITVIPTLLLITFFWKRQKMTRVALPFVAIAVLDVIAQVIIQSGSFLVTGGIYQFKPGLLVKNFLLYFFSAVVPQGHKLLYAFPQIRLLVFIAVPAVILLIFVKAAKLVKFLLLWDILLLTPFLPFNIPVQPRYLYLPSLALCVLLACFSLYILRRFFSKSNKRILLFYILIVCFVAGNTLIINVAAIRMKGESDRMKSYLAAVKNDSQKMDAIRNGKLPEDSPFTLEHLQVALDLPHEE